MRKLTGSPQHALPRRRGRRAIAQHPRDAHRRKITAEYPLRFCVACNHRHDLPTLEQCDGWTEQRTTPRIRYNPIPGEPIEQLPYARQEIEIRKIFEACLRRINFKIYPTSSKACAARATDRTSRAPDQKASSARNTT